jgi:hypothetical protein
MKVLLQDMETHLYLQGVGGWTADTNEALDFPNTSRAIEFWRDNDLLNVQIVLKYATNKHDVVLDVLPRRDGVASPRQPVAVRA